MAPARLTEDRLQQALAELDGWRRDGDLLRCEARLATFRTAVDFTAAIADLAEALDHHPEWTVRYRQVEISTTTHDANGLTELDVTLARQIHAAAVALGAVIGSQ